MQLYAAEHRAACPMRQCKVVVKEKEGKEDKEVGKVGKEGKGVGKERRAFWGQGT